jgi:hypothetical protein
VPLMMERATVISGSYLIFQCEAQRKAVCCKQKPQV